jgi:DNA-binding beta-propeller fold protein YncE
MKIASSLVAAALIFVSQSFAEKIVLVAGGDNDAVGVPATEAKLKEPFGTAFDSAGNTFIIEMISGNRLLKIDPRGTLTQIAADAKFAGPHNLAVLPDGSVLVANTWGGDIKKIDAKTGAVSALPGFGVPPERAKGAGAYCIALDFTGTKLYVADLLRIHAVDLKTGESRVVAGNGKRGKPEDGAVAVESPLSDPRAVAVDRKGNVYILERSGNALRVVDALGKIRTVVNASGKAGNTGDGGPALDATMSGPKHLCVDLEDNVIIADAENNIVRKFLPKEGRIVRVAGTGKKGTAGIGGDPLQCQLARPHGVVVNSQTGELFITDSYNNRVLKIAK